MLTWRQVGDGINDALALGTADVGIALHSGSPLAVASADVVLMRSSIAQIPRTIDVAKAVQATVKANILWATLYNAVLIPLAMGFGRPLGLVLHPYVTITSRRNLIHYSDEANDLIVRWLEL